MDGPKGIEINVGSDSVTNLFEVKQLQFLVHQSLQHYCYHKTTNTVEFTNSYLISTSL